MATSFIRQVLDAGPAEQLRGAGFQRPGGGFSFVRSMGGVEQLVVAIRLRGPKPFAPMPKALRHAEEQRDLLLVWLGQFAFGHLVWKREPVESWSINPAEADPADVAVFVGLWLAQVALPQFEVPAPRSVRLDLEPPAAGLVVWVLDRFVRVRVPLPSRRRRAVA